MATNWHERAVGEVVAGIGSDAERGIDAAEAARRLAADGPNAIRVERPVSALRILARQFRSLVVAVLVAAALGAALLGEAADAIAIAAIVILNAAIGFRQEVRSERAVAALRRLAAPRARVRRGGIDAIVPAADVVRGDLLVLEAGDLVAADARIVEAAALRCNEAPLTGESEPVDKRPEPLPADTPVADRANLVLLGTAVVAGTGRAIVVATGSDTEMGRIARLVETASGGETPLVRRLDEVARRLLWLSLAMVLAVVAVGLARSIPPAELLLAAVSLAVAAIPEGLPAVVTVALALGVVRMAARRAVVRRLPAVETLGAADVVCADKTGTLTVGRMSARRLATLDGSFAVTPGAGTAPGGIAADDGRPIEPRDEVLRALAEVAAGCNDARIGDGDGDPGVGDPTEIALLELARLLGVERPGMDDAAPRVAALPFDSERKRMSVVRRRADGTLEAQVKGAPEVILERCTRALAARGEIALDDAARERLAADSARLAGDGFRVLALARRLLPSAGDPAEAERDLVLLGLVGLQDPPREGAREAVRRCRAAGIRVVMITGDHPATAARIAEELGIRDPGDEILTGRDLAAIGEDELAARVRQVAVYARVTPGDKLRIVRAWKALGSTVAMTGDGVNDAPALEEASIGVAMGAGGTEVAREAADMILADDDFATIVAAVEEGRGIYENIAKSLGYLVAGNVAELAVVLGAVSVGWPLPLLPLQLLWVNLVTDGLPALALATDRISPGVLDRPPRPRDAQLMDRRFLVRVLSVGALVAAASLAAFAWEERYGHGLPHARGAAFTVLVLAQLAMAFGVQSGEQSVLRTGLLANRRLFAIAVASLVLQLALHEVPALAAIFGVAPTSAAQVAAWLALAVIPLAVIEAAKARRRRAAGADAGPRP